MWPPFKIVSNSTTLHSKWLLLLQIVISSIVHCYFIFIKMSANFSSSYMAMNSLTLALDFPVKFSFWFIQILHILREKYHLKISCSETLAEIMFDPRWLPLLFIDISNGKKKGIGWNFSMKYRSQIESHVSDYRLLRASSLCESYTCIQYICTFDHDSYIQVQSNLY